MKHADNYYEEFLRQFMHHFENREKLDRKAFQNDLGKIIEEETKETILKSCTECLNRYQIESSSISIEQESGIIENNKFIEKLIYYYMKTYEDRLTREILVLLLQFIGDRLFIYTFAPFDKIDYDFYCGLAQSSSDHFRTNIQTNEAILDNINYLRRKLYLTLHSLEFQAVPYRYKDLMILVMDDIKYSQKKGLEPHIQALNSYIQINVDHLLYSIHKSDSYINLERLKDTMLKFRAYLNKYREADNKNTSILYDCLSSYFKFELYTLKMRQKNGEAVDEPFKIRLFSQAAVLIGVFFNRNDNFDLFFNPRDPAYSRDLKTTLMQFSEELRILLNEEELNVFELLYLIFTFLSNFNEYAGLNKNVYQRLKFISRTYNRRTYSLLSTTLFLKLLNDRNLFLNEIVKVKNNIEANPTITLVTLYNNEIDTLYDLDSQTRNSIKIDPYIMTIMDCVSQISKNIRDTIIDYTKKHEDDEDFGFRKLFIQHFENEILNVMTLAGDPNLFRGLNQFYSSFLNSFLKNMKMDFREDYIKKLDQIKIDLMDLNPLDLQLSFLLSRLWKLDAVFKMNDPRAISLRKSSTEDYFKNHKRNLDKVLDTFLVIQGYPVNRSSIRTILEDMEKPTKSGSSFLGPGSRMVKVVDGLISKILDTGKACEETFLSLYEESYFPLRKQWIYDPIMLYYINYYLSGEKNLRFYREDSGNAITPDIVWLKKGEIVQSINAFINTLFQDTKIENDMALDLEKLSQMDSVSLSDPAGQKKTVTQNTINEYISENKTVFFESTVIEDQEDIIYLLRIMEYYLKNVGKSMFLDNFKYIIHELIVNANRGVMKRAHFKNRGLDIGRHYQIGLKDFLEKLDQNKSDYLKRAGEIGLKVRMQFQVLHEVLIISVINNYQIHPVESEEINKRYQIAGKYNSLNSIRKLDLSSDEGKGQGLAILNLMLKNIGLNENALKMRSDEDQTIFRVIFPLKQLKAAEVSSMAAELTRELDNIPPLPANIIKLTQEISKPDSSIDSIELIVRKDPPLAARIIQVANSPLYIRLEKVRNLKEAIQMIGLKGLNSIVLTFSSYRQLEGMVNLARLEQIISHSEKTAFFARELIRRRNLKIPVENIYLPALIHDIGKIVIECAHPDLYKNIAELSLSKDLSVPMIEDLLGGLYHNLVGYELARKWGFPEVVGNIIKFHHEPRSTDEFFDEIFLIYLANELTRFTDGKIIYANLDRNVLEFFEITSQEDLSSLVKDLTRAYEEKSIQ